LSVNPSKLAGQCGKLKCCLNYELDAYLDALKEFPEVQDKVLVTQKGQAKFIKIDVFRRRIYWAYENDLGTFIPLSIERTKDILEMNKNNVLPEDLLEPSEVEAKKEVEKELTPVTTESNLDRFNDKFKKNKKNFQNRKNK
jgi:cell fate regulator YaaT (PSP1 superfamily)